MPKKRHRTEAGRKGRPQIAARERCQVQLDEVAAQVPTFDPPALGEAELAGGRDVGLDKERWGLDKEGPTRGETQQKTGKRQKKDGNMKYDDNRNIIETKTPWWTLLKNFASRINPLDNVTDPCRCRCDVNITDKSL